MQAFTMQTETETNKNVGKQR